MTIHYALTRSEIVRSFYNSLAVSPVYRTQICVTAAAVGLFFALVPFPSHFGLFIVAKFALVSLTYFLAISAMLFLRGKTSERNLSISPSGISTDIGSLSGNVPWTKVRVIETDDAFVLIARKNGNAFFIPDRAFGSKEEKASFVNAARQWHSSAGS